MPAVLGGRPQCTALTVTGRRCNAVANTGDMCKTHAERASSGAYVPDRTYAPGIVYALVDRRNGDVRYIGQSVRPPGERLAGHLLSPPSIAFRAWLAECGRQVDIRVLREGVPDDGLDAAEHEEIRAHLDAGCNLLNEAGVTRPFRGFPASRRPPTTQA
ncbi:hypothetical protein [Kitasatospora sp. A2-31]|uniref:hypothetical protein n=1 Tax=Kitasatospora sp. A2-31 TaxID=2916414 RepID=UPI001EEA705A|nr:hypothetical protein [Kitasatospora sp. A2-31]MCG6496649.1 hypothetical protein [Kitasatospora sp. A2-31]